VVVVADDGRCRRRRVPADAGTPGHVLGAKVRGETTRCRAAIGRRRHRLRGMIPRRLRALSWGPAWLRPSAPLVARGASSAPRSITGV